MSTISYLKSPYSKNDIHKSLTPLVSSWFSSRFYSFSPPQTFSILNIKKRRNTLLTSPTGTGKTLSAFLAVLDDLVRAHLDGTLQDEVYCVYVSPLKALGNDVEQNLLRPLRELEERYGASLGIRVATRTGDTTASEKRALLAHPPHILITTPESLTILLASPKFSLVLQAIQYIIVDEVHAIASNKRGTQLSSSLERLTLNRAHTRIGLSATVAPLRSVAEFLVGFDDTSSPRQCDIVDVNYTKSSDIRVLCPVDNLIASSHAHMRKKQYELMHDLISKHQTTLIFTNTRSATERVVHELQERFPSFYHDEEGVRIRAHHGSLSKEIRLDVENSLRAGELRAVVCSTSLELGIDIGSVDLVVLLGSPKSVARTLQRIGRAGHQLDQISKGRIIVLDRDDLVESCVLAKAASEGRVDKISIPENCLDVLAQELYALSISDQQNLHEAYALVRRAYPFRNLLWSDFMNVLRYLAGEHVSLEDRYVYAKIWYDESTATFGRRGRLARVLYMTNTGTIPDQANVQVKIGDLSIGSISEPFLEHLEKGDVFVLGGQTYRFRYSRGMTAQVGAAHGSRPTVPSWYSEMLPLSFDVALEIQGFRTTMMRKFAQKLSRKNILDWLLQELPIDESAAKSVYEYMRQQYLFSIVPQQDELLVEYFRDGASKYVIVHSLFGRRTNDVLSRAVAFVAGRLGAGDADISISDNGFVLRYRNTMQLARAFRILSEADLDDIMDHVLERTEVLQRRFRHCAARALMILRNYKGQQKSVGRQQVSSRLLLSAVKRLDGTFPILKEARREVLFDAMELPGARFVLERIASGKLKIIEQHNSLPSPFAFNLILQGYADIMKIEQRQEFLKRLHQQVLASIALSASQSDMETIIHPEDFQYDSFWEEKRDEEVEQIFDKKMLLKEQLFHASAKNDIPPKFVYLTQKLIEDNSSRVGQEYIEWLKSLLSGTIPKEYGDELIVFLRESLPNLGWK